MNPLVIPTLYREPYERTRSRNPELADNYLRHVMLGDPELDLVLEELADLDPPSLHRFIAAGIEQKRDQLKKAPQCLRMFFAAVDTNTPAWMNHNTFVPANRAFFQKANMILVAFVTGSLIEGFSTLISRSFWLTGRVGSRDSKRRLGQNNRHILDIFYPGGLQRENEGFKLSCRIRFVHARVRQHLAADPEAWNIDELGIPLSAANMGLAITIFSARLLYFCRKLGVRFTKDEQQGVMDVFRYSGYVMGIPESILYRSRAEAEALYRIGMACEPIHETSAQAVANGFIGAIPMVANVKDPKEGEKLVRLAYSISRSLIGSKMADKLGFPRLGGILEVIAFHLNNYYDRYFRRSLKLKFSNLSVMLDVSEFGDGAISYQLPTRSTNQESDKW